MNATELFLLGRTLMRLAEDALPDDRLNTTLRLVLMDVAYHDNCSISEITRRTGFLQSHVSASVATLRQLGVVTTSTDPADRRRTLVAITPAALERGRRVRSRPIEEVLSASLGEPTRVADVVDALELLAARLMPEALAQLRGVAGS